MAKGVTHSFFHPYWELLIPAFASGLELIVPLVEGFQLPSAAETWFCWTLPSVPWGVAVLTPRVFWWMFVLTQGRFSAHSWGVLRPLRLLPSAVTSCERTESEETPPPRTIVPPMLPCRNMLVSLILLPPSLTLRCKVFFLTSNFCWQPFSLQSLYLWDSASIFYSLISCFCTYKLWCIHIPSQLSFY